MAESDPGAVGAVEDRGELSLVPGEGEGREPPVPLARPEVQALGRAFHHLAEAQEALLDQLEALERERRIQNRWLLPALAGIGLALGLALLVVGLGILRRKPLDPEALAAALPAPAITVQPPVVQFPEGVRDDQSSTVQELLRQLEQSREENAAYRDTLAEWNERLLAQEEARIQALNAVGRVAAPASAAAASAEGAPAPAATSQPAGGDPPARKTESVPSVDTPDPWLGALNGLLAVDGYAHLRFERGTRVPGKPELQDVTFLEWTPGGLLHSVTHAAKAEFQLHQMTGTLVVTLEDGSRTQEGVRSALPEEGWRLDLDHVKVSAWLAQFPELRGGSALDPTQLQELRDALNQRISPHLPGGYWRCTQLGGADARDLRLVQLQKFDGAGHLLRTLEADRMEILLHPTGDVELLLHRGAILEGGVRRPFFQDRFRIYLPKQPLEEWRKGPLPVRGAGA